MRTITITAAAVLASAGFTMAQDDATKPAKPSEPPAAAAPAATVENTSYAVGTMIAGQLKQMGLTPDMAQLQKGLSDAFEGKEPRLTAAQCQQVWMEFQRKNQGANKTAQAAAQIGAQRQRTAEAKVAYDKALAAGDKDAVASRDFLETNGKRKEVTTTASGLQYEVMTAADGPKPAASDTVNVHYHGTLPDGTVFDSSVERKEPISFPLLNVIAGWTEGVQLMGKGSKFKFFIPAWLAYGEQGSPPKIPANSALVFEVELLNIE